VNSRIGWLTQIALNRRNQIEQSFPGFGAIREIKFLREFVGSGDAGAGDSVIEAQQPDPAAGKI